MRHGLWVLLTVLVSVSSVLAENEALLGRRQRAAAIFHDGTLLVHAKSRLEITADGFRQDPYFYYFTGLQNTVGAVFAIRKNVPFWQVHTTNLLAGEPAGPLRTGTTINFEPIAAVDNQGFFLEDMYLITPTGAELLTPGVPYTAEDIEAAMR